MLLAARGELVKRLIDAALAGDVLALAALTLVAVGFTYVILRHLIAPLVPQARELIWARWRLIGLLSLVSLVIGGLLCWLFRESLSFGVFPLLTIAGTLLLVALGTSANICRSRLMVFSHPASDATNDNEANNVGVTKQE